MPINTYQHLLAQCTAQSEQLYKRLQLVSFIRLVSFVGSTFFGYYYFSANQAPLLFIALALLFIFFYMIRLYDRCKSKYQTAKAHIQINQTEIDILNGTPSTYEDGSEYIDSHHPYSYDLDIFGKGSLFPFLNRTTTTFGKKALAETLLQPDSSQIEARQSAIRELYTITAFRQSLQAAGMLHSAEEKKITKLTSWLNAPPTFIRHRIYYFLLLFPAITIISTLLLIYTGNELYQSTTGLLFVINLGITFLYGRIMMKNISVSSDITKTLNQFSDQLVLLEKQSFTSPLLKELQARVQNEGNPASQSIKKLASCFNYLDYLFNIFISPLLNGFFLFHIHILFLLDRWKTTNGKNSMNWLHVLGEIESVSSFATIYFNNPDFTFPSVSLTEDISVGSMGHPLIRKEKRINNNISFLNRKFVVLTGSNMSGKSTFLRTLGINLVLARAGSAVCALHFHFFPYDIYVSMRITDSLQDSESFFYAELKRLQTIIHHIRAGNKTFILLDEILRGTNSNDKHSGTVGLIHKLVSQNACGIIATHDLSVAELSQKYPDYINNNCFESQIINNELLFDYKIKEGVCTKLSASFLMKKMGIIE